MQTLTEIEAPERERRAKAMRYERLTNEVASLRSTVKELEAKTTDTRALEQIHTLCGTVPKDLVTFGTSSLAWSIPGGICVRDVLMQVAGNAIADAQRRDAKRRAALKTATQQLASAEAALQELLDA